jgi:hypothetical protein
MKERRREVSRVFAQQYLYSRVRISFQLRGVRRAKVSATLSNSTESVHLFTRAGSFTGGLTERQGRRSAHGDKLRTVRPHACTPKNTSFHTSKQIPLRGFYIYYYWILRSGASRVKYVMGSIFRIKSISVFKTRGDVILLGENIIQTSDPCTAGNVIEGRLF